MTTTEPPASSPKPDPSLLQTLTRDRLTDLVYWSLDHLLHDDALFYTEALLASQGLREEERDDSTALLAICLLRSGAPGRAVASLETRHLGPLSTYWYARALMAVKRWDEASDYLQSLIHHPSYTHPTVSSLTGGGLLSRRSFRVDRSALLLAYGQCQVEKARKVQPESILHLSVDQPPQSHMQWARDALGEALRENPFLWSASRSLAQLGLEDMGDSNQEKDAQKRLEEEQVGQAIFWSPCPPSLLAPEGPDAYVYTHAHLLSNILGLSDPKDLLARYHRGNLYLSQEVSLPSRRSRTPSSSSSSSSSLSSRPGVKRPRKSTSSLTRSSRGKVPSPIIPSSRSSTAGRGSTSISKRSGITSRPYATKTIGRRKRRISGEEEEEERGEREAQSATDQQGPRTTTTVIQIQVEAKASTSSREWALWEGMIGKESWKNPQDPLNQKAISGILSWLRTFRMANQAMLLYKATRVLDLLDSLIQGEKGEDGRDFFPRIPWYLCIKGRALHELRRTIEARDSFRQSRALAPWHISQHDYYSSILWHLEDTHEAGNLARSLQRMDREAPESWVALGNAMSLEGARQRAIECFRRATFHADSLSSAYIYSLCGDEFLSDHDHKQAEACFLQASQLDPNLFTAWYGLGKVATSIPAHSSAVYAFSRCITIHPENPMGYEALASVYTMNGRWEEALSVYNKAFTLHPTTTGKHVIFQIGHARCLIQCAQYAQAIRLLRPVLENSVGSSPFRGHDGPLHYLLGKAHKALDQLDKAKYHLYQSSRSQWACKDMALKDLKHVEVPETISTNIQEMFDIMGYSSR